MTSPSQTFEYNAWQKYKPSSENSFRVHKQSNNKSRCSPRCTYERIFRTRCVKVVVAPPLYFKAQTWLSFPVVCQEAMQTHLKCIALMLIRNVMTKLRLARRLFLNNFVCKLIVLFCKTTSTCIKTIHIIAVCWPAKNNAKPHIMYSTYDLLMFWTAYNGYANAASIVHSVLL